MLLILWATLPLALVPQHCWGIYIIGSLKISGIGFAFSVSDMPFSMKALIAVMGFICGRILEKDMESSNTI